MAKRIPTAAYFYIIKKHNSIMKQSRFCASWQDDLSLARRVMCPALSVWDGCGGGR